jgi:hypothetical protein
MHRIAVDKVKGVEAFAPHFPFAREEKWYFLLGEPSKNLLMAQDVAVLLEAEKAGASDPALANGLPARDVVPAAKVGAHALLLTGKLFLALTPG